MDHRCTTNSSHVSSKFVLIGMAALCCVSQAAFLSSTTASLAKSTKHSRVVVLVDRKINRKHALQMTLDNDSSKYMEKLSADKFSAPMDKHTDEYAQEMQVMQAEQALHDAIQREDWSSAAELRDELNLDQMHLDDCARVLSVNAAFYQAFSEKDVESMERVWMPSDTAAVQCIHPSLMQPEESDARGESVGRLNLVGYRAVLDSWKNMFDDATKGTESSQDAFVGMEPTNIRLSVKGTTAFLTCNEEVYVKTYLPGKGSTKVVVRKFSATNIFRKVASSWRMVHHHASHDSSLDDTDSSKTGSGKKSNQKLIPHEIVRGNGRNARKRRENNNNGDFEGISISGLEALGGGGSIGKPGEVKRVFMGSISDLLSGSLDDIISGSRDDDDDEIEGAIIRIGRSDDEDDEEDDDYDDDEQDDEGNVDTSSSLRLRLRDDELKSRNSLHKSDDTNDISSQKKRAFKHAESKRGTESSSISSQRKQYTMNVSTSRNGLPKDELRQNCISALRRLCNQGAISQKQKRLLLTDIITCSAKGEFSMVEVAYELLCGDDMDDDEDAYDNEEESFDDSHSAQQNDKSIIHNIAPAMNDAHDEEFADQCRVFANELALQQNPQSQ